MNYLRLLLNVSKGNSFIEVVKKRPSHAIVLPTINFPVISVSNDRYRTTIQHTLCYDDDIQTILIIL